MADDREERIRARAHSIWEAEGQPHGRHDDHWHQASAEADAGGGLAEGAAPFDPSGRSLGSAAQSDLTPPGAAGSNRAGSLVDTGPALGLAAGGLAGGSGGGALGSLSLGQDADVAGGMASIGSSADEQGTDARDPAEEAALGGIVSDIQSDAILGADVPLTVDEPRVPPRKG